MFPNFSLAGLLRSEPQIQERCLVSLTSYVVYTCTDKPLSLVDILWGKRTFPFSSENIEPPALGDLFPKRFHILITKMKLSQIMYVKYLTMSDSATA